MTSQSIRRAQTAVGPVRRRWAGVLVLALVAVVPACGGGGSGGSGDSAGTSETPTTNVAAAYDGAWSGRLSSGGVIKFTVTDGTISRTKLTSGHGVFGPRCGTTSVANTDEDAEIAIEDGHFSWGGHGHGYPVQGQFDSETTASGTAVFRWGKDYPGCQRVDATWEATRS